MTDQIIVERKITFQTFGKPTKAAKEASAHVMKIVGLVDAYQIESGQYGDYPVLRGDFLAISPSDEKARSGKLIVPMFVFDSFKSALDAGQVRVEIGLSIGTRPSEKGNTGYEWTVEPIFAPRPEEDPLLKLAAKMPAALEHKAKEPAPKAK